MNTERLFAISSRLISDLAESGAVPALNALAKALRAQMSAPSAENIATIEARLTAVEELRQARRFDYPETWNSALEHMGASLLKNAAFVDRVVSSVRGNSITLESAANAVAEVQERLTSLDSALKSVNEAFRRLGLESYELAADEAELSVLIPRAAFANELRAFSKDLLEITKFLELAEEISTGSRTPPKLDELSTTDPIIIAGLTAPACLFVLKVVKDIIAIIQSTYELREARAKALAAEASLKTLESIDSDIQAKIDKGLKAISDTHAKGKGRPAELRVELANFLPKIAARIDNGYRIEGAAGAEAEADATEGSESAPRAINNLSREITYQDLPPSPVLSISFSIDRT